MTFSPSLIEQVSKLSCIVGTGARCSDVTITSQGRTIDDCIDIRISSCELTGHNLIRAMQLKGTFDGGVMQ